jgi:hypothetical protein
MARHERECLGRGGDRRAEPTLLAVVSFLGLLSFASVAHAQAWDTPTSATSGVTAAAPIDTSDRAIEQLQARTSRELAGPLPAGRAQVAFELSVVGEQRDAIDLTGVNVMQGFGVGLWIATGVACLASALAAIVVGIGSGSPGEVFGIGCGGVGGGTLVIGVTLMAVAESDGDLHRRRVLDWRIRRLQQYMVALGPTGLTMTF